jgi:hypothetical protein
MISILFSLALLDVAGQWRSVDVTSIESVPGYCMRVWVEQRTWDLRETGRNRLTGSYRSVIRSIPVGAMSVSPSCKWPEPATKAASAQIRLWGVTGRAGSDGDWNVSAKQGTTTGELRRDLAPAFTTSLQRRGGTVTSADATEPRVFRPAAEPPAAAFEALQKTIDHLHHGGCMEVITSIGFGAEEARRSCEMRARIQPQSGAYQSLTVTEATEFDRVPTIFPAAVSFKRQHGVIVDFVAQYEKQQIRGSAILYDENGVWRVALLWL